MHIKNFLKNTLRLFHRHQSSFKDLYIISLGRAGSTLLAEMLNAQKGVRLVPEPLLNTSVNIKVLEDYFNDEFISDRYLDLDDRDFENLLHYFRDLSQMKTSNSIHWTDLRSRNHNFKTNRTVFKTHRLTYLFDDMLQALDAQGLYLIRHPISHSLSRMRLNWDTYIDEYMVGVKIKNHISEQALYKAQSIQATGSRLQKYVLNWCLENFVFLNGINSNTLKKNLAVLSYEEIIAYPEKTVSSLISGFGFSSEEAMLTQIRIPSSGIVHSTQDTSNQIRKGKTNLLLNSWRSKISDDEEKSAFEILEIFGFNLYQAGNDLPTGNCLLQDL